MTTIGLIGCGQIARDGYIPALAFVRPSLVLVSDRDQAAAEAAARELEARGVRSELCQTTTDVAQNCESSIVAVAPSALEEVVREIAEAGAPRLLVEKPLGVNANITRRILDIAAESRMELSYMETFLHSSATEVLIDELNSRRLGHLKELKLSFKGGLPKSLDSAWRGRRKEGGEVLHDWGIHAFGLAVYLLGAVGVQGDLNVDSVKDVIFEEFGAREILTSCHVCFAGVNVQVSADVSWSGVSSSGYDMQAICENGTLAISVGRKEGSSNWRCVELNSQELLLAERRYPKELFVRGVASFISPQLYAQKRKMFDPIIGLRAISLADEAYQLCEAKRVIKSR